MDRLLLVHIIKTLLIDQRLLSNKYFYIQPTSEPHFAFKRIPVRIPGKKIGTSLVLYLYDEICAAPEVASWRLQKGKNTFWLTYTEKCILPLRLPLNKHIKIRLTKH